jgi:hypothetical protein
VIKINISFTKRTHVLIHLHVVRKERNVAIAMTFLRWVDLLIITTLERSRLGSASMPPAFIRGVSDVDLGSGAGFPDALGFIDPSKANLRLVYCQTE